MSPRAAMPAIPSLPMPRIGRHPFAGLQEVVARYHWLCRTYCLSDEQPLPSADPRLRRGISTAGMRQVNGVYTQRFNRRHWRVGHVLQGRFTAIANQLGPIRAWQ